MPDEGNPALQWGLTGAIGLTVIGMLARGPILLTGSNMLGTASDQAQAGAAAFYLAIGCLSLIAYPAILLTSGILAARGTGRGRSGASAGALAMVVSVLVIMLLDLFIPARESPTVDLSNAGAAAVFLTSYVFCTLPILLCLAAGFGAGVGALGGLIGRLFYRDPFEDEQMPMSVAEAQYLGILPVSGGPAMPGANYPGTAYPPPPPPGYQPYPEYPPYPPGYQPGGSAPGHPYPPAQFAPPPGAYPPPAPYPPYAPPAYGYAPPAYIPPDATPPRYAPPQSPDLYTPDAGTMPNEGFQPEPPRYE